MTKQSDLVQKRVSNVAVHLRNEAFRIRRSEYNGLIEAARKDIELSDAFAAAKQHRLACDAALIERNKKADAIRSEIAKLQERLAELESGRADGLDALKEDRRMAVDALNALRADKLAQINQSYPDMDGASTPASWKSLDSFKEEAKRLIAEGKA